MARRSKTNEELEIKQDAPDSEDTQFINAADIEAAEAELLSEEVEVEASEEAEEAKPKRRRARRKKPELSIENAATEPEDKEEGTEITAAEEEESKPRRRSRKPTEEKAPIADPGFAAMNMEEITKQWAAIKDITAVISQNLEKAKAPQHKMSEDTFVDTSELFRPQVQKVPFIVKFATGASLVASLLSVLSLSLSQSARNAVLTSQIAASSVGKTVSTTSVVQSPVSSAPQIASNPLPKRVKETFFKIKK